MTGRGAGNCQAHPTITDQAIPARALQVEQPEIVAVLEAPLVTGWAWASASASSWLVRASWPQQGVWESPFSMGRSLVSSALSSY